VPFKITMAKHCLILSDLSVFQIFLEFWPSNWKLLILFQKWFFIFWVEGWGDKCRLIYYQF